MLTRQDTNTSIYCQHGRREIQLTANGMLANKRLAVKDLFAVAGEKNAAGNPDWFKSAETAEDYATSVKALLDDGCIFVGLTQTDEMAYSLEGNNLHYGTAENPVLPGHTCGGSSMGSAAAVANFSADIGLGTDTGGSVRVPASYCGLYGIRTSHGVVDKSGLIPLAPDFDTIGWFSRNVELLESVGDILLPEQQVTSVDTLLVCDPLLDMIDSELADALSSKLGQLSKRFKYIRKLPLENSMLINRLADTFRVLQGREIARTHGQWIEQEKPAFSPPIAQRFAMALSLTEDEEKEARATQAELNQLLANNLSANTALFLPTTPTIAPKIGADISDLRQRILTLTSIAGLSGSVQVHLPQAGVLIAGHEAPYGYSLLMSAGNDRSLLRLVSKLEQDYTS